MREDRRRSDGRSEEIRGHAAGEIRGDAAPRGGSRDAHEDGVGGLRVGQDRHDLVRDDHDEGGDEIEADDRDLRRRGRVEEEGVAVDGGEDGDAV